MKKLRAIEEDIAIDIYYNPAINPVSSVLFFYGFPAFVGPNALTTKLVKQGLVCIQPHFPGTYDSGGEFGLASTAHALTILEKCIGRGYFTKAKDGARFVVPSQISACITHSFGSFPILRCLDSFISVGKLIFLAPALHYKSGADGFGLLEDGSAHYDYVERSHPLTYRLSPKENWLPYLRGDDVLPLSPLISSVNHVDLIVGKQDSYFNSDILMKNGPELVKAYCGSAITIRTEVVEGAGHSLEDLVTSSRLLSELSK